MKNLAAMVLTLMLIACGADGIISADPWTGRYENAAKNVNYTISKVDDEQYVLNGTLFGKPAKSMNLRKITADEVAETFGKRSAEVVTYLVNEDKSLYFGIADIEKAKFEEMPRDLDPAQKWNGALIRHKSWAVPTYKI